MQSAYAYTPKFELWYNGIIWQAIYNCVNSFNLLEFEERHSQGVGISRSVLNPEVFVQRVRVLYDLLLDGWADNDFKKIEEEMAEEIDIEFAHKLFQAILALLHRRGHIRFKPPRDFDS